MYVLAKNMVFADAGMRRFRLLKIEAAEDTAHVIELDDKNAVPMQWSFRELQDSFNNGKYQPVSVATAVVLEPLRDKSGQVSPAVALKERRWRLIKDLVDRSEILYRAGRKKLLADHAKAQGCSPTTLMQCIRRYLQGGMTQDALFPNFQLCGIETPDSARKVPPEERKVRGRRREDGKEKFHVSPELAQTIWERADELLKSKLTTRKRIYRALCKEFWSTVNASGKVVFYPDSERPSRRQVSYIINKHHSKIDELKRQSGPGEFRNDHEARTGNVLMEALGVGHQYEMDATILDFWIVARENRNKIIGKPTLYLIRDRYSRLIVGYYLTLDPPSWAGAKEAILSLVEDREARAKKLGVPWRPHLHPALGILPGEIILDRGSENIGHGSDRICTDVETTVVNLPAHFSSGKGMVECGFYQTHVPLKDNTAGYQPPAEAMRRHGDRYEHDATYILEELDAELYQIFEALNELMYPDMPQEVAAVLAGVPPIPVEVWKHDQPRSAGWMRQYDSTFLRMKLLPSKRAVVTQKGIRLNGIHYTCQHAEKRDWFVRAGKGVFPVKVTYDRKLTNIVYVHDPQDPRRYYEAQLTQGDYSTFAWKSHAEASVITSTRRRNKKLALDANDQRRVQLEYDGEQRAANAKRLTDEAIAAAAGASRTSDTRQVRADEVQGRLPEVEARMRSAAPPLPAPTTPKALPGPVIGAAAAPVAARDAADAGTADSVVLEDPLADLFGLSKD